MSEIFANRHALVRIGGRTSQRFGSVTAGSRRGHGAYRLTETIVRADASTCASFTTRDGNVAFASANKLRLDWTDIDGDGVRESCVLSEASRSSGWDQYNDLNGSNWTKENVTVTVNATTAPDGTSTADKIVEDATVGVGHGIARNTPALTDNTLSPPFIYAKAAERTWLRVRSTDKANTVRDSWVNLATGTAGTTNAGHTLAITAVAGQPGWYKVVCRFNAASGGTTPSLRWALATGDTNITYTGNGTSGLYLWGGCFEANQPFESSLIAAVNGLTTRQADDITVPWNYGPQSDYTVLIRLARSLHMDLAGALGISPGIFAIGAGTAPRIGAYCDPANRNIIAAIDTATTDATQTAAIPAGHPIICLQYKNLSTTGGQVAIDTGSVSTAFSSAATAFPQFSSQVLRVGRYDDYLFGGIYEIAILRGLFSRTEALAMP